MCSCMMTCDIIGKDCHVSQCLIQLVIQHVIQLEILQENLFYNKKSSSLAFSIVADDCLRICWGICR